MKKYGKKQGKYGKKRKGGQRIKRYRMSRGGIKM